MKSKQMFQALIDTFRNNVIEIGQLSEGWNKGAASRDEEVAELKAEVNRLVHDVSEMVDQNCDMESKLRDAHLDSYNAGVQTGRESEVTKATVKIMSDAAARTIFAGERWR